MDTACVGCGEVHGHERCPQCGAARAPGGYRVEKVLAQTAHSRMYVAVSPDGVRVALKELVFALVPGTPELDAFDREVAVLNGLDVPGVPRFLAAFQEGHGVGTRLYLAQEFVEGTSLAERLRAGRFDEQRALAIARHVLEILDRLHSRVPPIVHRDVKPANLVERADGEIVLVDFGSARVLQHQVTFRSTLVGTYGYMPPEQLAGSVDATADLYALGATLAHLLSGLAPTELMGDGLALEVDARIPTTPAFRRWLSGLLAPTRTKRFPSAKEALRALDALQAPAPPPLAIPHRAVAIATGVLVLAGLGGVAVLQASQDDERPTPARAEVRPSPFLRKPKPVVTAAAAPREPLPPVEVVSLERVLPAGTRSAFWLESEFHVDVASRHRTRWGVTYGWEPPVGRSCTESPIEYISGYSVSIPREMTVGAQLEVQMGRYGGDCQSVRLRLVSEDGEEMRRISDAYTPSWVILRQVPRYTLFIDKAGTEVPVKIDLEARRITLP